MICMYILHIFTPARDKTNTKESLSGIASGKVLFALGARSFPSSFQHAQKADSHAKVSIGKFAAHGAAGYGRKCSSTPLGDLYNCVGKSFRDYRSCECAECLTMGR